LTGEKRINLEQKLEYLLVTYGETLLIIAEVDARDCLNWINSYNSQALLKHWLTLSLELIIQAFAQEAMLPI
jgi:hypothetical protein